MVRPVGSVGYDNALAESLVDSFKTVLIADRLWRTRSQLELAVVEYLGWFNHTRLHESLGDLPPAEFEAHAPPAQAAPRRAKDRPSTAGLCAPPVPSEIMIS
jgi:transposase InsO family protein